MTKTNDEELIDDSIRPQLEWHEIPGLALSFLWFYRGVLLAALVIAGLYFVFQFSKDSLARKRERDRASSTALGGTNQRPGFRFRDELTPQERNDQFVDHPLESTPDAADAIAPTRESVVRIPVASVTSPKSLRADPDLIEFRKFLSTASPEQLILKSQQLSEIFSSASLPVASSSALKQRQISERLQEMNLNEEQEIFADVSALESLSSLDALNVQNDFGLPGIREELIAVGNSLLTHRHPDVVAKSNLALTMCHGCDLLTDQTPVAMEKFLEAYKLRIDSILNHQGCALSVARYLLEIRGSETLHDSVDWIVNDFLQRCQQRPSEDIQAVGVWLTRNLVFEDLDPAGMIRRMESLNGFILADIEEFFRRLEQHPQMTPDVFATALAIIATHQQNGHGTEAAELSQRLRRMLSDISNPESKKLVQQGLEKIGQQADSIAVSDSP